MGEIDDITNIDLDDAVEFSVFLVVEVKVDTVDGAEVPSDVKFDAISLVQFTDAIVG